jgi:hypothetical protein
MREPNPLDVVLDELLDAFGNIGQVIRISLELPGRMAHVNPIPRHELAALQMMISKAIALVYGDPHEWRS